MKYIDIHCHLNFHDYDANLVAVIERAEKSEVGMIVVGTNQETSKKAVELAVKYPKIWAIVGLHPIHATEEKFDIDYYRSLAVHPKVVGIGECGFDYFRASHDDKKIQEEAFLGQISLANELNKPLMLHIRSCKAVEGKPADNAYRDALDVLKKNVKVIGDAHFFAGSVEEAKEFLDMGFYISFTGVVTFARDYDTAIKSIPSDRILSETDSPYVSPAPYRGQVNEPAHVVEVAHTLGDIRGEQREKFLAQLIKNAETLFRISL